jgi:ATP-dependent Clp protease protease subunit
MSVTGHIFIYGEIGKRVGEVSVKNVMEQIKQEPNASDYVVHIISNGGDVFEGFGIYNTLKNLNKPIVTHIESIAASIASLIAFAGDKIVMNKTSQFMIHNPTVSETGGDAKELRNVAGQLDKIKELLMDVAQRRAARNGKTIAPEVLSQLYDNETWMTSDEAVNKYGFADEVTDAIKAVARIDNNFKMEKNENAIINFFKALVGMKKFKNEFTETLQDGTKVIVMSEDGDWTGKQIISESGEPLPAGDYTLASGKVITVGENSTIAEVKEAAPAENPEDMKELEQLKAQLAAEQQARQEAEAKLAQNTAATAQLAATFENRFKEMEKKIEADKAAQSAQIFGLDPKKVGPVFANMANDKFDPMGEDALAFYKTRNLAN